jgi:hypothetical protein
MKGHATSVHEERDDEHLVADFGVSSLERYAAL